MSKTFENRMTTQVKFGKYKEAGKTYGELLNGSDDEAGWVVWLYNNEKAHPNPNYPKIWDVELENLIRSTERRLKRIKDEAKYADKISKSDDEVPF